MRALAAVIVVLSCAWSPATWAAGETVEVDEDEPEPYYVPELRAPLRKIIGFDFGIGLFDGFSEEFTIQGGISADFFAGIQFSRRVGVVVDLWSLVHLLPSDSADDRGVFAHSIATASGRVWLAPAFWVQAGLGAGFLSIVGPRDDVTGGPAGTVAFGSELQHRPTTGIDLSLRIGATRLTLNGATRYIYNVSAVAGYHWN